MKGMVFTELLEMVEDRFGFDMVDAVMEKADLPSGGIYTAVGTYDHAELVSIVGTLSSETGIEVPDLLKIYGQHLFGRFSEMYPMFFEKAQGVLDFLESIEDYIHVEVKKLYPDAELPSFDTERISQTELIMDYRSSRHMEDFAVGLIEGCLQHFGCPATLDKQTIEGKVRFFIKLNSADQTCQ